MPSSEKKKIYISIKHSKNKKDRYIYIYIYTYIYIFHLFILDDNEILPYKKMQMTQVLLNLIWAYFIDKLPIQMSSFIITNGW